MARLPNSYHEIEHLSIVTSVDLNTIELKAKVLSLEECFDYLLIIPEEISKDNMNICKRVWRKGRMKAIDEAGTKLFSQMSFKGGHQASMDYLRQMSGTFSAEITPSAGSGFKFNVVIDPKDK